MTLSVSVVIPTRDRCALLARIVHTLQDDDDVVEIIVVDDGSTDGTAAMVQAEAARDPRVRVVSGGGQGPAHARQVGVDAATADVVVFLDDDVVPGPGLVGAHRDHHERADGTVVVGYMPPAPPEGRTLDALPVRIYAGDYDAQIRHYEADAANVLRDLWGGNLSMRRSDALRVSLNSARTFTYHEDKDLGLRCAAAGLRGVFDRTIVADHHVVRPFAAYLHIARLQGVDLVRLHDAHPELGPLDVSRIGVGLPRAARLALVPATVPFIGALELRTLALVVRVVAKLPAPRVQVGAAVLVRAVAQRRGVRAAQHHPGATDGASSRTERPSR